MYLFLKSYVIIRCRLCILLLYIETLYESKGLSRLFSPIRAIIPINAVYCGLSLSHKVEKSSEEAELQTIWRVDVAIRRWFNFWTLLERKFVFHFWMSAILLQYIAIEDKNAFGNAVITENASAQPVKKRSS